MQQVMTKFHIRGSSGLGSRFNDGLSDEDNIISDEDKSNRAYL